MQQDSIVQSPATVLVQPNQIQVSVKAESKRSTCSGRSDSFSTLKSSKLFFNQPYQQTSQSQHQQQQFYSPLLELTSSDDHLSLEIHLPTFNLSAVNQAELIPKYMIDLFASMIVVADKNLNDTRILTVQKTRHNQRTIDTGFSQTGRGKVLRYYNNSTQSPRPSSTPQTLDFRNQRWDTSGMPATIPQEIWDMRREENRLKSFYLPDATFTASHVVSVKELAADGFFYLQESDRVKCAFCKGVLKDWEAGEQVREAHRRHFSTCPFVLFVDVGNEPITDRDAGDVKSVTEQCSEGNEDTGGVMVSGDWSAKLVADLPPVEATAMMTAALATDTSVGVRNRESNIDQISLTVYLMMRPQLAVSVEVATAACSERALTNLSVLQHGLQTDASSMTAKHPEFSTYSSRSKSLQLALVQQPAYLLAKAGFFCMSDHRVTCCFSCGLQVRQWGCDDDVWVEHARWSPRCPHVLLERGSDFVLEVHRALPPVQPWMSVSTKKPQQPRHVPAASANDRSDGSSEGTASSSSSRTASTAHSSYINEALAMTLGVEFRVEARDIKARADLPVVRLLTQLGFSALQVRLFTELHLKVSGDDFASSELFLDYMFRESRHMLDLSLDPEAFFQARMAEIRRNLDVQTRPRESIDWKTCKVCMDKEVNILLLDCGHVACCSVCAKSLKTCPMCRAFIRGTLGIKE